MEHATTVTTSGTSTTFDLPEMPAVVVGVIGPAEFTYKLNPGEAWHPHPAGGIIVVHPERKPLWCHMTNGAYVQEWLELPATATDVQVAWDRYWKARPKVM